MLDIAFATMIWTHLYTVYQWTICITHSCTSFFATVLLDSVAQNGLAIVFLPEEKQVAIMELDMMGVCV